MAASPGSGISSLASLQQSGGVHYYVIYNDVAGQSNRIGQAIFDPARAQYAFLPDVHALVLTSAQQTAIVAVLNGLSK